MDYLYKGIFVFVKKILKNLLVVVVICIISSNIVFGADILYRFMHNDHDVLVIGQIIKQDDYSMHFIEVSEIIVSDKSMNSKKQQTDIPKIIQVYTEVYDTYKVGDNVAISLNKNGGISNTFKIANGMYKLTTNNSDTLEVINFNDSFSQEDNAVVEVFLKSRGKYTDFYFNEKGAYLYDTPNKASDKDRLVYDKIRNNKVSIEIKDKNKKILISKTNQPNISTSIFYGFFYLFFPIVITLFSLFKVRKYFIKKNPDKFILNTVLTTSGIFIIAGIVNYVVLYIIIIGFLYQG